MVLKQNYNFLLLNFKNILMYVMEDNYNTPGVKGNNKKTKH